MATVHLPLLSPVRIPYACPVPRVPCPVPAVRSFRSLRLRLYTGSLSSLAHALLRPVSVSVSSSRVTVDVVLSRWPSCIESEPEPEPCRPPASGLRSNRTSRLEPRGLSTQALLRLLYLSFLSLKIATPRTSNKDKDLTEVDGTDSVIRKG